MALAATFPLAPGYRDLVGRVVALITSEEARQLASFRAMALDADQRIAVEQLIAKSTEVELVIAKNVLPTLIFVWVALLVALAERMARRLAELVRRPLLPAPPFAAWRLPDGAVWLLVTGLALARFWTLVVLLDLAYLASLAHAAVAGRRRRGAAGGGG